MTAFELGPGVTCDLDILGESRMLLHASSGGGKSRSLRRIAEQTHGMIQQIVIDPEGELVSLREKFDYVLVAAQGGDAQAHPRSAALLAERLLELGVSAILDLSELKPAQRPEFVANFCHGLVNAPRKLWRPVLVMIDEVQLFAPEGQKSVSTEALINLATLGRKRGQCLIAATQRISFLDKNVAAVLHNKLIGFAGLDVDMDRAARELGFDKQKRLTLRELQPMQFWAFGPALTRTPQLITVGSHITSHPKAGSRLVTKAPTPTPAKIKALLPKLADLPAEADQRAKSEADLRLEITGLKRQLAEARKAQPAPIAAPAPPKPRPLHIKQQDLQRLEVQLDRAVIVADALQGLIKDFRGTVDGARTLNQQATTPVPAVVRPQGSIRPLGQAPRKPASDTAHHPTTPEVSSPVGQRMLDALAELAAMGIHDPERVQLAFFCGYTNPKSGGFTTPLGALVTAGLVEAGAPGRVRLTPEGVAQASTAAGPASSVDLQQRIIERLDNVRARMLEALIGVYPQAMARTELANRLNYTNPKSGGFTTPLGSLVALGLVQAAGVGEVAATSLLFLEGDR